MLPVATISEAMMEIGKNICVRGVTGGDDRRHLMRKGQAGQDDNQRNEFRQLQSPNRNLSRIRRREIRRVAQFSSVEASRSF